MSAISRGRRGISCIFLKPYYIDPRFHSGEGSFFLLSTQRDLGKISFTLRVQKAVYFLFLFSISFSFSLFIFPFTSIFCIHN